MSYRFFTIPIQNGEQAEEELNGFLRGHRILSVDKRWVDQGALSFWAFCIDCLDTGGRGAAGARQQKDRGKVDYRDILSPEEFAVFAKLRDLRGEMAKNEAVPVYTIFTNEQLARMVQAKVTTKAGLHEIEGVGDARVEKYGALFLEILRGRGDDEAGGKPV